MPARTIRMPAASDASSSVATGSTSLVGSLSGSPPGGTSATGGQPVEPDEEDADQQRPDHELGQRDRRQRADRDRVVDRSARVDGGERAQPERERDHEQRRDRGQDQRVLDRVGDQIPDRRGLLALRQADRRVAEVAVHEAAEPVDVLLVRRAVEVQLRVQLGRRPRAWRCGRARRWRRRRAASPCPRRSRSTRRTAPGRRRRSGGRGTRARARPRGHPRLARPSSWSCEGAHSHRAYFWSHASMNRMLPSAPAPLGVIPLTLLESPSTQSAFVQFR